MLQVVQPTTSPAQTPPTTTLGVAEAPLLSTTSTLPESVLVTLARGVLTPTHGATLLLSTLVSATATVPLGWPYSRTHPPRMPSLTFRLRSPEMVLGVLADTGTDSTAVVRTTVTAARQMVAR